MSGNYPDLGWNFFTQLMGPFNGFNSPQESPDKCLILRTISTNRKKGFQPHKAFFAQNTRPTLDHFDNG